MIVHKFKHFLY